MKRSFDLAKMFSSIVAAVAVAGSLIFNPSAAGTVNAAFLTPRLIVTGSEITSGPVTAGEDFEMVIHLQHNSIMSGSNLLPTTMRSSPQTARISSISILSTRKKR